MAKVRKHVIIKGRVQGVWFRSTVQQQAMSHGVTGWVQNNLNGNVEAMLEGELEDVEKVIEWCYRGPKGAIVKEVEVKTEEFKGEFSTFSIKSGQW